MDRVKIYARSAEKSALAQIKEMSECEAYGDCMVRIMPDCHAGPGLLSEHGRPGATARDCKQE